MTYRAAIRGLSKRPGPWAWASSPDEVVTEVTGAALGSFQPGQAREGLQDGHAALGCLQGEVPFDDVDPDATKRGLEGRLPSCSASPDTRSSAG